MKKMFFASIVLVLLFIILIVRFFIGGFEDDWICQNGQWVKHGNPASPKPESGCAPKIVEKAKDQLEDSSLCYSAEGSSMNLAKAKEKAVLGCKNGKLLDVHSCNSSTGTWWIDFAPNTPKEGCNPACIVSVDTGAAEINWRCTGLVEPNL